MSEWGLQAKCVDSLNYAAQNISELQAIYFDFSFLFPTLEQEFLIFFPNRSIRNENSPK